MIVLKYKDTTTELEVKTSFNKENMMIIKDFISEKQSSPVHDINITSFNKKESAVKTTIKDRLPNKYEKDEDEKIIEDKPTAERNFMCPHCHQSMTIMIDNNIILKDIDEENRTLYMLYEITTPINNSELLKLSSEELTAMVQCSDVNIVSSKEIMGKCINCNSINSTYDWVNAYKNKEQVTGFDRYCEVCGSEALISVNNNDNIMYKCENTECGREFS